LLEDSLNLEVKESLLYIAGYIARKKNLDCGTFQYYAKYGMFQDEVSWGKLCVPPDFIVQWVFFAYILFHEIKTRVCKKSLTNALMLVSDVYSFNIEKECGITLSNILLNNYCHMYTPVSSKERKQKVLKLSKNL